MAKSISSLAPPITWGNQSSRREEGTRLGDDVPPVQLQPEALPKPALPTQPLASVLLLSSLFVAMYWLAFSIPYAGYFGFFAFAPLGWMIIDARPMLFRAYVAVYGCGVVLWIGLRTIASSSQGLFVNAGDPWLAVYLALYVPLFVLISRCGRESLRLPIVILLPLVWCGLEWVRCNLFGGFALGSIAHAVAYMPEVVQVADLQGSYGLGSWMVACSAAVVQLLWTMRRVRWLENKVGTTPGDDAATTPPAVDAQTLIDDERGFTSAGRFRAAMRPLAATGGGARVRRKKTSFDSQKSMTDAVRRNRDTARERDLTTAAFSILMIATTIVLASFYAVGRVGETTTWKMFEGYRYVVSVIGGQVNQESFAAAVAESSSRGMIVYASTDTKKDFRDTIRHSVLAIAPKSRSGVVDDKDGSRWTATLRRLSGQFANYDLGSTIGAARWFTLRRPLAAIPVVFPRDETDVKIRVLPLLAYGATIEQSVNDSMRKYLNRGKSIDAAVVVMEPSTLDGGGWPRLMARAVVVAAASNRCPVIAIVPDKDSFAAAGDGSQHQASSVSGSASDLVSFSAMIDPRDSLYAKVGEWPAAVVAAFCAILVGWAAAQKLSQLRSSGGVIQTTTSSQATSTAP